MTNLGQVCLFSNLITIFVQCCSMVQQYCGVEAQHSSLFTGFKNLLEDDLNFRRGGDAKKEGKSNIKGEFFYQSKLLSHFVPVSPYTTLNIPWIKLSLG